MFKLAWVFVGEPSAASVYSRSSVSGHVGLVVS